MLIVPKRGLIKPSLGAQINPSHPLAHDMVGCFLVNEGTGARLRNLVSGADYEGVGAHAPALISTPDGLGLDCSGAADTGMESGPIEDRLKLTACVSILWRGYFVGTPGNHAVFAGVNYGSSIGSPYLAYSLQMIGWTNAICCAWNYNGNLTSTGAGHAPSYWGNNKIFQQVGTINLEPSIGQAFHYSDDAVLENSTTGGGSPITYGTGPQLCTGNAYTSNSSGENSNIVTLAIYIWARQISREEVSWLWSEPYAMVMPSPARRIIIAPIPAASVNINASVVGIAANAAVGTVATGGLNVSVSLTGLAASPGIGSLEATPGNVTATGIAAAAAVGTLAASASGEATITGLSASAAVGSLAATAGTAITGIAASAAVGTVTVRAGVAVHITGIAAVSAAGVAAGIGDIQPITSLFSLTIGTRDVTRMLEHDTMSGNRDITGQTACTFTLYDRRGRYLPRDGDEVVYSYQGRRVFGGLVQRTVVQCLETRRDTRIVVSCVGYQQICQDRTYENTFRGPTIDLRTVVTDIVAVGLSGEGLSYDAAGETSTIDALRFVLASDTVYSCFQKIARDFGYNFWIDNYRRIVFERANWQVAPYVIRDQRGQDGVWRLMKVTRDASQYRNTQGARTTIPVAGAVQTSSDAAAIARRAARTGRSGKVEVVTTARNVMDQAAAFSMNSSLLARYGAPITELEFESDLPYWEIGQVVHVFVTHPAVAGMFQIRSLNFKEIGLTFLRYTLTLQAPQLPEVTAEIFGNEVVVDFGFPVDLGPGDFININGAGGEPAWTVDPLAGIPILTMVAVQVGTFTPDPGDFVSTIWELTLTLDGWAGTNAGDAVMLRDVVISALGEEGLSYGQPVRTINSQWNVHSVDRSTKTVVFDTHLDNNFTVDFTDLVYLNPPSAAPANPAPGDPRFSPGLLFGSATSPFPGGAGGQTPSDQIGIVAITAVHIDAYWELTLTLDGWAGTLPGEGVQIRNVVIEATGGEGLSYGQPTLRINGAWNVRSVDQNAKTITIQSGLSDDIPPVPLDDNPIVDFSGLVYKNSPDGTFVGTAHSNLNGAWRVGSSTGNTATFVVGQVCHILSVEITQAHSQFSTSQPGDGGRTYDIDFKLTSKPQIKVDGVDKIVVLAGDTARGAWDFSYEANAKVVTHNDAQTAYTAVNTIVVTLPVDPDFTWQVKLNLDEVPVRVGDGGLNEPALDGYKFSLSGMESHVTGVTSAQRQPPGDARDALDRVLVDSLNGQWESETIGVAPDKWIIFVTGTGRNENLNLHDFVYDNPPDATVRITAANDNPALDLTNGRIGDLTAHTGIPGDGDSKAGQKVFNIVYIRNDTAEITVDADHGFSTSYPDSNSGTVVAIFGVDAPYSINNGICRITVTGARTFIAEDTDKVRLRFDEWYHGSPLGRVVAKERKIGVNLASGPSDALTNIFGLSAGNVYLVPEKATFLLANAVPGLPVRPLVVGDNVTNPYTVQADIAVVDSVYATIGTPGLATIGVDGSGDIKIDVTKNGTSIFSGGSLITFPGGSTDPVTMTGFAESPLYVEQGDTLNVSVKQTGSEFPGCNMVVIVNMKG